MNPSRTLADRFRTQRTERIRVDGTEIHSVLEVEAQTGDLVEVVVESCHDATVQGLGLTADAPLAVVETAPSLPVDVASTPSTDLRIDCSALDAVVVRVGEDADAEPEQACRIRLWNTWLLDEGTQAWTGNAGIVVEDVEVPDGADRRLRAWCSDGLGNASFDDLVVVVTVGPDPDGEPA